MTNIIFNSKKLLTIALEELRDVHAFANLTMASATPKSTTFQTAHTVYDLTSWELERRQRPIDTHELQTGEADDSGFVHVTVPMRVLLERALVEICEGTSDTAFDVARERFSGSDARKEAIALLKERQENVIQGSSKPAHFDTASRDLLLQLQLMDSAPVESAWAYLHTLEGGQQDATMATQQVESLDTTIQKLDQNGALYRTRIDTLKQQLTVVTEPTIVSSSWAEAVTSSIIDPVIVMTEMVVGPQTRLSMEKEIIRSERALASCEKTLLQAQFQKETWLGITEDIQRGSSFMKRLAVYNQCVQNLEKERLDLLERSEKPDDSRDGVKMVSMGNMSSTS